MDGNIDVIQEFYDLNKDDMEFNKKSLQLCEAVKSNKIDLLRLVEQLGPLLIDPAFEKRDLGTAVLSTLLESLPSNFLNEKQLIFLVGFYADRLKDNHQVVPSVLQGILAITSYDYLPKDAGIHLLQSIFHNIACQQQQQADRRRIFMIFQNLLEKSRVEISKMGLDYVYGIISSVDGERDPRNLILLFNWYPKFLKSVNLGHLTEEMFEVLACYFPIDFRAPPQDPNSMTREMLSEALSPCLCAIPEFADPCLSLALEKLDSSLKIAKLDSLQLLRDGCETFDVQFYMEHAPAIWSQIQKEIFSSSDEEYKRICLNTFSRIIKKLSQSDIDDFGKFLKDIADTVKGNLIPNSKLYNVASEFLHSIAVASEISSKFMAKEILPLLTNTINLTTNKTELIQLLQTSSLFVLAYFQYNETNINEINTVFLLTIRSSIDPDVDLQRIGYACLGQMTDYLPEQLRKTLYENFKKVLMVPTEEETRQTILKCFRLFAMQYPKEVKNVISDITINGSGNLNLYFETLCTIADHEEFMNFVINILTVNAMKDVAIGRIANFYIANLLKKHEGNGDLLNCFLKNGILDKCITWTLDNIGNGIDFLNTLSFTLRSVIGFQSTERQQEILNNYLPIIINIYQQTKNYGLIFLIDGILSRVRRDVKIDYHQIEVFVTDLLASSKEDERIIAVQLLANLLNKSRDDDVFEKYFFKFQDDPQIIPWVTKAIFMKNGRCANDWVDKMMYLLDTNPDSVKGFGIVVNDDFDSLSIRSYCNRTLLYQQKFFVLVTNKLVDNYKTELSSYLSVIGHLFKYVPKQAILLQFPKIYRLVLLSLENSDDPEELYPILGVLETFITSKENCIEDHLDDLLTRIINIAIKNNSMNVRILALGCIKTSANAYPTYKLLPIKSDVLIKLEKCIDDKKRIVRKIAVDARLQWFLLDAPV